MKSDLHSILLLLLLLPCISLGQTIHLEKDKVAYKGKIALDGKQSSFSQARNILLTCVNASPDSMKVDKYENELCSTGLIQLPSPYHLIKHVSFKVKLQPKDDQINYEIDDIRLIVRERGGKPKVVPAEQLLKKMEEHGKVAVEMEKELNEIDMYIQKLLAYMQR